jgi:hypothetical protein
MRTERPEAGAALDAAVEPAHSRGWMLSRI